MAERSNFNDVAINSSGTPLGNVKVSVVKTGGVTPTDLVTIYGSKTGGSIANEFLTPTSGLINFWVSPGSYDAILVDQNVPKRVGDKTFGIESVSGDIRTSHKGIDFDQIDVQDGDVKQTMIDMNIYQVAGAASCSQSLPPGLFLVNALTQACLTTSMTLSAPANGAVFKQESIAGSATGGGAQGEIHIINAIVSIDTMTTLNLTGLGQGAEVTKMTIFGIGA